MTEAEDVLQLARLRAEAHAEGDPVALMSLLHPDLKWTAHVGEAYDRDEYVRRNTTGHTVWKSQELFGRTCRAKTVALARTGQATLLPNLSPWPATWHALSAASS